MSPAVFTHCERHGTWLKEGTLSPIFQRINVHKRLRGSHDAQGKKRQGGKANSSKVNARQEAWPPVTGIKREVEFVERQKSQEFLPSMQITLRKRAYIFSKALFKHHSYTQQMRQEANDFIGRSSRRKEGFLKNSVQKPSALSMDTPWEVIIRSNTFSADFVSDSSKTVTEPSERSRPS